MKVLHLLKSKSDETTNKIIDVHKAENEVKVIDLTKGDFSYESIIEVSSAVLFTVPPGKPLGKFDMVVTAKDAATGKEIGKGSIPFMLLPPGVGGC